MEKACLSIRLKCGQASNHAEVLLSQEVGVQAPCNAGSTLRLLLPKYNQIHMSFPRSAMLEKMIYPISDG